MLLFTNSEVLSGAMRGLALQNKACYAGIVNYLVSLPVGILLAFKYDIGLPGFSIGMASG